MSKLNRRSSSSRKMTHKGKPLVLWFKEIGIADVGSTGGKNASLGEMYQNLGKKGLNIPNGFAITAHAYHYLIEANSAKDQIKKVLSDLDTKNLSNLAERGSKVRRIIRNLTFPADLTAAIAGAYKQLCSEYKEEHVDVAVRSSATAEDLPDASFAGQQESFLNIQGEEELLHACKLCFASLFTNRAISYRELKGFDHFSIGLSIGVQKMVRSDLACSGVMFSLDTESGFRDVVLVTGAYGLGENVVQGAVAPDEFLVHKPTLAKGFNSLISKQVGAKELKMIYDATGGKHPTKNVPVAPEDRRQFCLQDSEVLQLAKWAVIIEDHYSTKAGHAKPMDMEWAKDGKSGTMFIVQARPETVHSQTSANLTMRSYVLDAKTAGKRVALARGKSVGQMIGSGKVEVIKDVRDIKKFKNGGILVTQQTDPDWEPVLKAASGVVTNSGGRTCHAAIISRELGIPCIVGAGDATENLPQGKDVTVDCSAGDEGVVWEGKLPFSVHEQDMSKVPKTRTKIMMIVGSPERAFEFARIPNQGVGLARMEFIINTYIRIHPLALIAYPKVASDVKEEIDRLTVGYADKKQYFVERLAMGFGRIAAAFYPNPAIVRMSDFKTNEYSNLIGGARFEPQEDNPMIGWRGASRYYDPRYEPGFALECAAMKVVRERFGLTNVIPMIPFCRTVAEGKKVIATMAKYGLKQGENGLKIYAMCEIPANVILAEQFLDVFDGYSLGTNDLTQLVLGMDRDSGDLANIADERNEAVTTMIASVIKVALKKNKYIGICGQGPSDFPELAEFLVKQGIQSIALNPDSVLKTTFAIAETEARVKRRSSKSK